MSIVTHFLCYCALLINIVQVITFDYYRIKLFPIATAVLQAPGQ